MPRAIIRFSRLVQDSQDYGSTDEHMVSRVFFDLEVDGKNYPDLYANVKQTVGSSIEDGPIEVSRPEGYRGPMNHSAFQAAAERYYRSLVGKSGSGIRISGGSTIRMRNNTFVSPATAEIDVSPDGRAW